MKIFQLFWIWPWCVLLLALISCFVAGSIRLACPTFCPIIAPTKTRAGKAIAGSLVVMSAIAIALLYELVFRDVFHFLLTH